MSSPNAGVTVEKGVDVMYVQVCSAKGVGADQGACVGVGGGVDHWSTGPTNNAPGPFSCYHV